MRFGFKDVGHFFSVMAQDIVKGARAAATVLEKIQGAGPEIEGVTSVIFPQAVEIERGAFALLGIATTAVERAGSAAAANGVNLQLDAEFVEAIRALIPALESYARSVGAIKPAPLPIAGG